MAFEPTDARQRVGASKIRLARDGAKFLIIILKDRDALQSAPRVPPGQHRVVCDRTGIRCWTIATQQHVTNSSVLLIMLAVIVFLVGLVSEQISTLRFEGRR